MESLRYQIEPKQFSFTPVKPGNPPLTENVIEFTGYLTSWNFDSNPSWDSQYDMGRADPKVMYKNSSRTLTLNFKAVANNEDEHKMSGSKKSIYKKLKELGNLTLPIYGLPGSGYNGLFVQYVIGSFLAGYGYISSFTMTSGNDVPWIDSRPVIIDCGLTIVALANSVGKVPRWQAGDFWYFGVEQS